MILKAICGLICCVCSYLLFWPVAIDPAAWSPPTAPSLVGKYAENTKLEDIDTLNFINGDGPEDVAIDKLGRIYTGLSDGRIIRFSNFSAQNYEVFSNTQGRPLGLDFDDQGNLIVADSFKGLLSIDSKGNVSHLTSAAEGIPFKFTDDVAVAKNGIIYFSDASFKFGQNEYKADALEHRPNGRLLSYNPENKETNVLLRGLYFANGVAVSEDQTFVLVNETWKYRIRKYWLKGPKVGQSEIIVDNLPGFPDGISTGTKGIFWVAVASPRDPMLDNVSKYPWLKKIIMRLPKFMRPKAKDYAFILGINGNGEIAYNLQDPSAKKFTFITSVEEAFGTLFFGSLQGNRIGRYDLGQSTKTTVLVPSHFSE